MQVLAELEDHPWDIILFSETRAISGTQVLVGGHVLYSNIDVNNKYAGVAILLHAKHVKKNIRVHRISGRVIGIDYKMHGRNYCAIATYYFIVVILKQISITHIINYGVLCRKLTVNANVL